MGNYGCKNSHYKHGGKGTKLYWVGCSMRARCNRKTDKRYDHYGGRGIKVCSEEPTDGMFTEEIVGAILEQHTIDAAPVVHGRWIECDDDIYTWIECSKCGFEQDIDDCGEHPHEAGDYMLCPACGARMDGGEDDGLQDL